MNRFTFIKIQNGFHYDLVETEDDCFRFIDKEKAENFPSFHEKIIDLSGYEWFPLDEFNYISEKYFSNLDI
jgi:hypothetical protein